MYGKYTREIKWRVGSIGIGWIIASIYTYKKREVFFAILFQPLEKILNEPTHIVYGEPTEAFSGEIGLVLTIGLLFSIPLIWIQIWFFMAPSLYKNEQKRLKKGILLSILLLGIGIEGTKEYILPKAWAFFLSFGKWEENWIENMTYLPMLNPYMEMSKKLFVAIMLSTQLPMGMVILMQRKWINEETLIKIRPWVILILLLWAALITPPDLLSQLGIFLPLFILYEGFIWYKLCQKEWRTNETTSYIETRNKSPQKRKEKKLWTK